MSFERTLERSVPAGLNYRQELQWLAYGGVASLIYSLGFLIRYSHHYQSLFQQVGASRLLDTSAVMPDFVEILGSGLIGFLVLTLCMAALLINHYAYHYQGSKSIYLMQRLPSRWELHRRCITLPLLAVIVCLCVALLLLLVYFAIYLAVTPPACLAPQQWPRIWNAILGVSR